MFNRLSLIDKLFKLKANLLSVPQSLLTLLGQAKIKKVINSKENVGPRKCLVAKNSIRELVKKNTIKHTRSDEQKKQSSNEHFQVSANLGTIKSNAS